MQAPKYVRELSYPVKTVVGGGEELFPISMLSRKWRRHLLKMKMAGIRPLDKLYPNCLITGFT